MDMMFYHIYRSLVKSNPDKQSRWLSLCVMAAILAFNMMSLIILLDIIGVGFFYSFFTGLGELEIFGVYLLLAFTLYLVFFPKRHEEVILKYSKRELSMRKKGALITLAYGVLSLLLVFILAPLR